MGGDVGDFMTAIDLFLARSPIAEELAGHFKGIEPREIVVGWRRGSSVKYNGPELKELWMPLKIPFNPEGSTLELVRSCDKCGRREYKYLGIEEPPHEEKIEDRWEMVARRPRKPGMGVILPESALQGCDFFDYGNNFHMCTARAKEYIESRGWTNIEFIEYGEVIED